MWYTKFVTNVLTEEARFILLLQNSLHENNPFFLKLSKLSDPAYAISILFPVFASLDTKLGYQVVLVSSSAEWVNTLLKWALVEPRPYWWVREAQVNVPLRQTELTCETGPGSPSGHAMGTAAVLYVLITWLLDWFSRNINPEWQNLRRCMDLLLWTIYGTIILLVTVSRVNIAAHFPHQCILGAILGYLLARFLIKDSKWTLWRKLSTCSKSKMIGVSFCLAIISFVAYDIQNMIGFDPGWSIKLAFKWCHRPSSVSVNTTPIFSLVRAVACLLGLSCANPLKERQFYPVVGVIVTTLYVIGTRMLKPIMPTNDPLEFYLFHFIDNVFLTLCLLTVVPYVASLVRFKEKTK